jgi:hypothetical protein
MQDSLHRENVIHRGPLHLGLGRSDVAEDRVDVRLIGRVVQDRGGELGTKLRDTAGMIVSAGHEFSA